MANDFYKTDSQTDLPLMPADERRSEMRARINVLAAVTPDGRETLLLEVVDISTGGMRVRAEHSGLTMQDALDVELEIDGESIEVRGTVVNLVGEFAGVKFTEISSDDVLTLELVLSRVGWTD